MMYPTKRTNQTIVAALSLFVIVIAGIPWVDEYRELRQSALQANAFEADWNARQKENNKIEEIQRNLAKTLNDLESRTTTTSNVEQARDRIIEIVRLSGSRLRQLEVVKRSQRSWAIAGDSLHKTTVRKDAKESPYQLHSHTLALRAEGNYAMVRAMMDKITSQTWMMKLDRFTLSSGSADRQTVSVELVLTLYGLEERTTDSDSLAAI
jgi:hypothetical protein